MKFSKLSQLFLVSTIGLLVATLLTACQIVTIDYVFVACAKNASAGGTGSIDTFAVDSESGALRMGAPTVSAGGVNPVAMAVTSDYANLYVANATSKTVVHFAIASNGVLTLKDTITTSAAPASLAVNPAGTYLYVVTGTTSATLTEYALSSGTIGSATASLPLSLSSNPSDEIVPTGVTVPSGGGAVYVSAYDLSAYNPGGSTNSTANPGWVFGYTIGSGGALAPTSGSPYAAGVKPSALAAPTTSVGNSRFLYVTDFASSQMVAYAIQTNLSLSFLVDGPFKAGNEPSSIAIDPRGKYIYISNALDSSVAGYTIDQASGTPSSLVNSSSTLVNATDTQPVSIAVDPALGRFIYTANHLGNSVSGFRLNPDNGTLTLTQATPYPTDSNPNALVIVPHGNHSLQSVTP